MKVHSDVVGLLLYAAVVIGVCTFVYYVVPMVPMPVQLVQ